MPPLTGPTSTPDLPRRAALRAAAGGLAALAGGAALTGCAGLGGPRTVVLGEPEIERWLTRRFPQDRRVMELVDVTLSRPRVRLLPERNRLATEIEVRAADRLFGRATTGLLALDYALRFEPSDGSVRLTQVNVQQLRLDALSPSVPMPVQRLAGILAEKLLDDAAIWSLKPDELRTFRAGGAPATAVTVTARGVEITLGG